MEENCEGVEKESYLFLDFDVTIQGAGYNEYLLYTTILQLKSSMNKNQKSKLTNALAFSNKRFSTF
jgi:hypothetical protein